MFNCPENNNNLNSNDDDEAENETEMENEEPHVSQYNLFVISYFAWALYEL